LREPVDQWRRAGHLLDIGIGIDMGYATLGTVELAGKIEYGAIGTVVHVARRLADLAQNGQILMSQRVQLEVGDDVECTPAFDRLIAGFRGRSPSMRSTGRRHPTRSSHRETGSR